MERTEAVQVLTLWFVVLIFLQTASSADNPLLTAVGIVAIVLSYVLPLYLVIDGLASVLEG